MMKLLAVALCADQVKIEMCYLSKYYKNLLLNRINCLELLNIIMVHFINWADDLIMSRSCLLINSD